MRVASTERICGVEAAELRRFFRRARHRGFGEGQLAEGLDLGPEAARRLAGDLVAEGWITRVDRTSEPGFEVSDKACRLALASFARPLLRTTADRKLRELLARVEIVNREACFLYRVDRVLLFGSMLTEVERVSDIDLVVHTSPKLGIAFPWWTGERRIHGTLGPVRSFGNIVEALSWPQAVVLRFLKSRSRAFSFHDPNDAVLERVQARQIFP